MNLEVVLLEPMDLSRVFSTVSCRGSVVLFNFLFAVRF